MPPKKRTSRSKTPERRPPTPKASRSSSKPRAAKEPRAADKAAVAVTASMKKVPGKFGFRSAVAVFGSAPMFVLLTYVPWSAWMRGDLVYPDILVSDAIACTQWHRSIYTTFISMAALSSCLIYSEMVDGVKNKMLLNKKKDDILLMALDQFLFSVYSMIVPNTLILISFMFEEEAPADGATGAASVIPSNMDDFIQWLFHVVAATLVFIGLGVCAFLYAWHIGPKTLKLGLESESDVKTRMVCAVGIAVTVVCGGPIRAMHIYHSREIWALPLLMVEVIALGLGIGANVFGGIGMMMELDANFPKLLFRNLSPGAFWTTFGHPFVHFTPFWSVKKLMDGAVESLNDIHTGVNQAVGVWRE